MEFKQVKLKDICIEMHQGVNTVADKVEYKNIGIPIIQSKNITAGFLDLDDVRYLDEETYEKYKEKYNPKKGDILICNIGTIGSSYVIDKEEKFLIAWNLFKLNIDRDKCNSKYVKYYLDKLKSEKYFNSLLTGGTVKFINKTKMSEICIPIVKLELQEKIVNVLDKAKGLIDKRKAQIEALDELVKSQFIEMFGDPVINSKKLPMKPLGEICNMKAGKSIKAKDIYEVCDEGMYPCYGGNGLRGYTEIYTHEGNIPLIGRQGALCGNVQYAKGKFYATEHAIVTQPKGQLNTCWLYIMLREMNLNRLASGAAQPGLNVSTLIPMEVILPPIQLQNQFADFVKQVDKLKFEMQNSLDEMQNNFDSLMQKAFNGESFKDNEKILETV